jgi:tRNA-Thr(GGU) m(6)t(6)A37 methyltransferase TsaA
MKPIGYVKSPIEEPQIGGLTEIETEIIINDDCAKCLDGIEEFSHIVVLYWLDRITDYRESCYPQGREDVPPLGMLATRYPDRPNPVGLTTARLITRDGNSLKISGLDVLERTPIIDIKPYYPPYDKPRGETHVPDYIYNLAYYPF